MLARLWFDALVGSDHQQDQINPAAPCQHVADEALMAGDIHEAKAQWFAVRHREFKVGKSNVNRYSPAFFFLQAIGIDSGQRLDEGGFSVIDVAGGANDDGFHRAQYKGTWMVRG